MSEVARERTREREREREQALRKVLGYCTKETPYVMRSRISEKKHLASLPRVIHLDETNLEEGMAEGGVGAGRQVESAISLPYYYNHFEELKYPIYTMTAMQNPGKRWAPKLGSCAGHRHFFEAVYYGGGGIGYEEQDGVRYDFEGEGILCVPTYAIHTHTVTGPFPRGIFAVISRIFDYLGIADFEQVNPRVVKAILEATGGEWPDWYGARNEQLESIMYARRKVTRYEGEPKTVYDRYLKLLADENNWRMRVPRFVKADDMPWEQTRQGRIKYLSHPFANNCCLRTLDVFLQEIPPGGSSGKHRHIGEEVIVILDGKKGYDIHDGAKYEWKENDLVCIPLMTTHQHFNTDPKEKVKFLSISTRWYYFVGHGGIEQLEDAPDYRPT